MLNLATDFELNNAPLTIRDLTIRNGRDDLDVGGGGAYILAYEAPVEVTNCKFINNVSSSDEITVVRGAGGFFRAELADLTLTNNLFENNVARSSAGLARGAGAHVAVHLGNIAMTNNVFRNNSAEGRFGGHGGGSFIEGNVNVTLVSNQFDDNTASAGAFIADPSAIWRGGSRH